MAGNHSVATPTTSPPEPSEPTCLPATRSSLSSAALNSAETQVTSMLVLSMDESATAVTPSWLPVLLPHQAAIWLALETAASFAVAPTVSTFTKLHQTKSSQLSLTHPSVSPRSVYKSLSFRGSGAIEENMI